MKTKITAQQLGKLTLSSVSNKLRERFGAKAIPALDVLLFLYESGRNEDITAFHLMGYLLPESPLKSDWYNRGLDINDCDYSRERDKKRAFKILDTQTLKQALSSD